MDLAKLLIAKNSISLKSPKLKEGLFLIASGEIKQGEEILLEVARGGESNAYIILGYLMEVKGNHSLMEHYYNQAYRLGNPTGYYHLGRYYFERGNLSLAREFLQESLEDGVNQSADYLKIVGEKKDREYLLFITFGPFFLLSKKEYQASFWCLFLFCFICFISYRSLTPFGVVLIFYAINFFFSDSFDRSNS